MVATGETAERHHILVVDDDDEIRDFLTRVVERLGHEAIEASSVPKALKVLSSKSVDLMLLDIYLKGATGLDLIKSLHRRRASVPTVVISGYISEPVAQQLVKFGVQGLVSKPFRRSRLEEEIAHVFSGGPTFLDREEGEAGPGQNGPGTGLNGCYPETERRHAERIGIRLPVKAEEPGGEPVYLQMMNLSATGMQTFGKHPDLLRAESGELMQMEIPAVANLAWLHAERFGNGFVIGWKFDDIIDHYVHAMNTSAENGHTPISGATTQPTTTPAQEQDRRNSRRIAVDLDVLARGPNHKRLGMKLVNISAEGMQTYSDGMDVLRFRKSAPTQRVVFDIPIEARFRWMEPREDGTCVVGWEWEGRDDDGPRTTDHEDEGGDGP